MNFEQKPLAPILVVAFNRPYHLSETLLALSKNYLSKKSKLYVSIDGPKNKEDVEKQKLIDKHIKENILNFKEVKIFKNEENKGLALNITESIEKVLKEHKKIILVEDDLVTSKVFLNYMNDALNYYEDKKRVWHIAGKNEVNIIEKKNEVFLWRFMHCSGWGTWKDRWENFEKNAKVIMRDFSKDDINKFNLDGTTNSWAQIEQNASGKVKTWAILWYATIFKNQGLCVSPWYSYVKNIGCDGSGMHDGNKLDYLHSQPINSSGKFTGVDELCEDKLALSVMKSVYKKKPLFKKLLFKIFKIILGEYVYNKIKNYYIKFK